MILRHHVGRWFMSLAVVAATLRAAAVATAASTAPPPASPPPARPAPNRQPPPPNVVPAVRLPPLQPPRDESSDPAPARDGSFQGIVPDLLRLRDIGAPAAAGSGLGAGSSAAERSRSGSPSSFAPAPRTYAPSVNMAQPSWSINPSGRSPVPMTGVSGTAEEMARAMRAAPAVGLVDDDAARRGGAGTPGVGGHATRGAGMLLGLGVCVTAALILKKKR